MRGAWFWRLMASGAMLGLVFWQVAPKDLWQSLLGVSIGWFILAALALGLQIVLSALRWQVTARALGLELPRGWAFGEYGLAVFSNTFLPGGVLGDLTRILRTRHLQGWRVAAASVVIERLAGQVALALVALGAVATWLGPGPGSALSLGAALATCAGLVALHQISPKTGESLSRAWTTAGIWPAQLALTLAILAVNLFGFWAAARAIGVTLAPFTALFLIPLTLLVMLVPVTVNGWGLREGVAAALWPMMGIDMAQAVAASITFGLACALAALIGVLPWLVQPQTPAPDSG